MMSAVLTLTLLALTQANGFEDLLDKTDKPYVESRTKYLSNADAAALERDAKSPEWPRRAQAKILQAWRRRPELYSQLEATRLVQSRDGKQRAAWILKPPEELDPDGYFYYLEKLLKTSQQANSSLVEDAGWAIIALAQRGEMIDVQPLYDAAMDATVPSVKRRVCARVLYQVLGQKQVKISNAFEVESVVEMIEAEKDPIVMKYMLGAAARGSDMLKYRNDKAASIAELPAKIAGDKQLAKIIGKESAVRIASQFDSPQATAVVVDYLQQSPNEWNSRWALSTLAAKAEPMGIAAIAEFSRKNDSSKLAQVAVDNLRRHVAEQKLLQFSLDAKQTAEARLTVVETLLDKPAWRAAVKADSEKAVEEAIDSNQGELKEALQKLKTRLRGERLK